MATTHLAQTPIPEPFAGLKVIDIDAHFTEPPDLWTSRVPAAYKDRVPHVERGEVIDHWVVDGVTIHGVSITVVGKGREKHRGIVSLKRYADVDPSTYDAKERVKLMDDMGIWAQIIFPNVAGFE